MGITDMFQDMQPQASQSDYLKILKELSAQKNKRRFSDLSDDEIKIFAKLEYLQWLLKQKYGKEIFNIGELLDAFLELRYNRNRKSREEFVDSFKGERTSNLERGMIRNMFNQQGGGGMVR